MLWWLYVGAGLGYWLYNLAAATRIVRTVPCRASRCPRRVRMGLGRESRMSCRHATRPTSSVQPSDPALTRDTPTPSAAGSGASATGGRPRFARFLRSAPPAAECAEYGDVSSVASQPQQKSREAEGSGRNPSDDSSILFAKRCTTRPSRSTRPRAMMHWPYKAAVAYR